MFNNSDKMGQFLEKPKPPQLTQNEINILNNTLTIKEIKFVNKKFLRPTWFHWRILLNI